MELFVTSAITILLSSMSARQIIKISRGLASPGTRKKLSPCVAVSCVFFLFTECIGTEVMPEMVVLGLVICLMAILVCSISQTTDDVVRICSIVAIGMELLLGVLNMLKVVVLMNIHEDIIRQTVCWIVVASGAFLSVMFTCCIIMRLRDVKTVMKIGSPWSVVCLCVDAVYVVGYLVFTCIFLTAGNMMMYSVYLSVLFAAASVRIMNSSAFVLWTRQEARIIESMKTPHLDAFNDSPGVDILYKSIYDRVLEYFEETKPYLNNDLTINDIVGVVFANKLYISRAISHYTGRNFCQFVNYYRVCHAVELFRENPFMKIVEMANKCGFNSAVSFSTAFRLFMGENPGDWCRKERVRLDKLKK